MNLRNVLRAYSLLRQLSDDESALLNILRALNDVDRQKLIETMSDKPQKKAGKKSAGGGGGKSSKSARASGMAKALNDNLSQRRQEALGDITGESAPHAPDDLCTSCVYVFGHNVHHLPSVEGYHEFQPEATSAGKADAQSAASGS